MPHRESGAEVTGAGPDDELRRAVPPSSGDQPVPAGVAAWRIAGPTTPTTTIALHQPLLRAQWQHVAASAIIVARHALGYVVSRLRLDRLVPFHHGRLGHAVRATPYTRAEHLRLAMEELGPTAIKIGQILSTRGDVLAAEYQQEFAKLQDAAPPEPFPVIRTVIERELGRPIEAAFVDFDPEPLAAASIGQAHAARLRDGTEVVVKVRRPGVVEHIELDLDVLEHLVGVITRRSRRARQHDLVRLTREFSDTLRAELDYRREADNVEQFAVNFANDVTVRIPRIYRAFSTSRILTLQRLHGIKIDDLDGLDMAGIDRVQLAERAAAATLTMIFEHGFFHADPHPGNFFIEPGGRIGVIDFGMVGSVDEPTRAALTGVLVALGTGDATPLVDAFLALGVTTTVANRELLTADLQAVITTHLSQPLGDLALGPMLSAVFTVVRRHRLHFPSNLALLAKTLTMCEGLAARLDPTFRMSVAITPYLARILDHISAIPNPPAPPVPVLVPPRS